MKKKIKYARSSIISKIRFFLVKKFKKKGIYDKPVDPKLAELTAELGVKNAIHMFELTKGKR